MLAASSSPSEETVRIPGNVPTAPADRYRSHFVGFLDLLVAPLLEGAGAQRIVPIVMRLLEERGHRMGLRHFGAAATGTRRAREILRRLVRTRMRCAGRGLFSETATAFLKMLAAWNRRGLAELIQEENNQRRQTRSQTPI